MVKLSLLYLLPLLLPGSTAAFNITSLLLAAKTSVDDLMTTSLQSSVAHAPGVFPGSRDGWRKGWKELPSVEGAQLEYFEIRNGARMPVYVTKGYDPAKLKRVIIASHGKHRDGWNVWSNVNTALSLEAKEHSTQPVEIPGPSPLAAMPSPVSNAQGTANSTANSTPNSTPNSAPNSAPNSTPNSAPKPSPVNTTSSLKSQNRLEHRNHVHHGKKAVKSASKSHRTKGPNKHHHKHHSSHLNPKHPKSSYNAQFDPAEILIIAPEYLSEVDKNGAYTYDNKTNSSANGVLVWNGDDWAKGYHSLYPAHVGNISSFDVIDWLVNWSSDRKRFPKVEVVMVAGHSAGGQLTQRYVTFGKDAPASTISLRYWISNPASFIWLDGKRPESVKKCPEYNDYKYGFDGKLPTYALNAGIDRKAAIFRYITRKVHYAFGLDDQSAIDHRCQAMVQGKTHIKRGKNFVASLERIFGRFPQTQTVDYIKGVGHQEWLMFSEPTSRKRLFVD